MSAVQGDQIAKVLFVEVPLPHEFVLRELVIVFVAAVDRNGEIVECLRLLE